MEPGACPPAPCFTVSPPVPVTLLTILLNAESLPALVPPPGLVPPVTCGCSQDFSWRSQITKENERHLREKAQLAARLVSGDHSSTNVEIESAKRIFGDSNLVTKMAQRQDPDHTGLAVRHTQPPFPPTSSACPCLAAANGSSSFRGAQISHEALEAALTKEVRGMSEQVQAIARKLAAAQKGRVHAELRVRGVGRKRCRPCYHRSANGT